MGKIRWEVRMPAIYLATMMDSGHVKWRPKLSIPKEGPAEKTVIIEFMGSLSNLPWVYKTSYGYEVDVGSLRLSASLTFSQDWFPENGVVKANIQAMGNRFIIEMRF
jgi:hypothetical protein